MIREKLSLVSNGQQLTIDLVNKIINRIEYAALLLAQYKLVEGSQTYIEPHFDGTRVSFLRPVGGGSQPSFRGGNVPFPNPLFPNEGYQTNQFLSTFQAPSGQYVSVPSWAIIYRGGGSYPPRGDGLDYEFYIDLSQGRELDEDGQVVPIEIRSVDFFIYYSLPTSDGGYAQRLYPVAVFNENPPAQFLYWSLALGAVPGPGALAFSIDSPSISAK